MNNLYEILGVSQDATLNEIKSAYKAAAKEYHPDLPKNRGVKEAAQKMQEINDAFAILKDGSKRHEYDQSLMQEKQQAEQRKQQAQYENQRPYNQYNNRQQYSRQQYNSQQYNNQRYSNQQQSSQQYSNQQYTNQQYTNQQRNRQQYGNPPHYSNPDDIENDEKFRNLSQKEQERIKRKIQRQVQEEYQRRYEEYLRHLGYRVKHRITLKDILNVFLIIRSSLTNICLFVDHSSNKILSNINV